MEWLRRWFRSSHADAEREARLALEAQIQTLRLDLQEREAHIARLREELSRARAEAAKEASAQAEDQLVRLLEAISGPAAQLHLQNHLAQAHQKPVQARDVLSNVRRLLAKLEDAGLRFEGKLDAEVPFDPDLHQPMSSDTFSARGESVVVRIAGVFWQGRALRRADVELVTSARAGDGL